MLAVKASLTVIGGIVILLGVFPGLVQGYGSKYKRVGGYTDSIDNNLPLSVFYEFWNKSVVVSSIGIRLPMCVLASMSQGKTQEELMSALGLVEKQETMLCYRGDSKKSISAALGGSLIMVNKIYLNDSKDLNKAIFTNTSDNFGVDLEPAIFKYHNNARRHINNWIDNKSLRRLRDTLEADDISSNTSILVVNAMYFKVTWEQSFNLLNTRMKPFQTLYNTKVKVPMMYNVNSYRFYNDMANGFYLVTKLLKDIGLSFTIVVPYKMQGLPELLRKLAKDPTIIQEARLKSTVKLVKLQMPKFTVKTKSNLDEHLKLLGIRQIYNTSFGSGLGLVLKPYQPLDCQYVALSKVKQQVLIDVDEYGIYRPTDPGALYRPDIFGFVGYGAPSGVDMEDVNADHPFYFSINLIDQTKYQTGPTFNTFRELFTGVYYGPESDT